MVKSHDVILKERFNPTFKSPLFSGSEEGSDLIRYHKRPSYCANSYRPARVKVVDLRPTDPRSKARRLQRISLRRGK